MDNYFQLLNQRAKPLFNDEELKAAYLAAIEKNHPDTSGLKTEDRQNAETKTALINRAYQVLKFPLERFRHLLELQGLPVTSKDALPDAYASLFELLYSMSQRTEKLVEEFKVAETEIEKTFLRQHQLSLVGDIQTAQRQLNRLEQGLYDQVKKIDEGWDEDRDWEKLTNIVQSLAFCQKWQSQLDRFKGEVLSRV